MKKWIACVWIGALCLGLLLYSCIDGPPAAPESNEEPTVDPVTETTPTEPQEKEPVCIYILDEDGDTAAGWAAIVEDYQAQTGVEIKLWDGSESQQPAIVVQSTPPAAELCADLSGTAAYAQLTSWDLAVRSEGKVCAIATEIQGFGLLCNPWRLASVSSLSEINSLEKLREAAVNMESTGLSPFAALEPENLAVWLAMLPEDGRSFAELYVSHMAEQAASAEESGAQQLHQEKAVFCLGSTDDCVHAEDGDTAILPVYLGRENEQNQTLCVVGSRYLSVRSDVPQEQLAAAVEFLDYLVLPGEDGTVPLDKLQRLSPFRQATYAGNALEQALRRDLTAGKECLVCTAPGEPSEALTQALLAFAAEPTDENWQAFVNAAG